MNGSLRRVAVLFSRLSGYTVACLTALKKEYNIELLVYCWPTAENAPFDHSWIASLDNLRVKTNQTVGEILFEINTFDPDAVFLGAGWMDRDYLRIARVLKKKGTPVISGSDHAWSGNLKQQLGRFIAPWYLHTAIDVLWIPGDRQRVMAEHLGYKGENCWSGHYACDWDSFSKMFSRRRIESKSSFFLYVGRYIEIKGLDLLIEAYQLYRTMTKLPWQLVCVGAGKLNQILIDQDGVTDLGFIQPNKLPELMLNATAFVLPSKEEPWGVVIQEAAATGLPLICSESCGAVTHLLQDGYNGFICESGSVKHLADCMFRLSQLSVRELSQMSLCSFELSKQFTPKRWARTFVNGVHRRKTRPDTRTTR